MVSLLWRELIMLITLWAFIYTGAPMWLMKVTNQVRGMPWGSDGRDFLNTFCNHGCPCIWFHFQRGATIELFRCGWCKIYLILNMIKYTLYFTYQWHIVIDITIWHCHWHINYVLSLTFMPCHFPVHQGQPGADGLPPLDSGFSWALSL